MSFRLSQAFISKYEGKQPNWGFNGLGYVVYKRSYARYYCRSCGGYLIDGAESQQTCDTCKSTDIGTEEFWQTCQRVVEGTFELQRRHVHSLGTRWNAQKAQASAQEMFKLMWNFKFLPPGRGLWSMGTPIVMDRGNGTSLLNCGYCSTQEIDFDFPAPFCFLFEASAHGVGIGFDTKGAGKTTIIAPKIGSDTFVVEDSREGWSALLRRVLLAYVGKESMPKVIDYSLIRPFGAPIKTFGGTASGPEALRELIETDIPSILTPGKITSAQIVDVMNVIGKCVVAGGARRSSEIALGDIGDQEFINLKLDKEKLYAYRWNSNNTVYTPEGFNNFEKFVDPIMENGEPGFYFLHNAQRYGRMADPINNLDQKATGVNPCLTGDTLVYVADGRGVVAIRELADAELDVPVFCINDKDEVVVRTMRHPRITGHSEQIYKVTLDDGSTLRVTGNHKFRMKDGTYVPVVDLKSGDSLDILVRYQASMAEVFPNTNASSSNYQWVRHGTKNKAEHRIIAAQAFDDKFPKKLVVHHRDRDSLNNTPSNLEVMTKQAHDTLHIQDMRGDANPMRRARAEWSESQWESYRQKHSDNNSGELNNNYSGVTNEDIQRHALLLAGQLRRKFSVREWKRYAKDRALPQQFSTWRKTHLNGVVGLSNWAAQKLGFIACDVPTRSAQLYSQLLDQGYDCFVEDGELFVRKNCEVCGKPLVIRAVYREQSLCSISCANARSWAGRARERRLLGMRRTYSGRAKKLREAQAKSYSDLKFELGRAPKKQEWVDYCKRLGISAEISRKSSPFRSYSSLQEAASNYNHKVLSVELDGVEDVYNGTVDDYHNFFVGGFEATTVSGKPKQIFVNNLQCGEQTLESYELCNIAETFPANCESLEDYLHAIKYAYLYTKTVTLVQTPWARTNEIMLRNRRIGLSMSGIIQNINRLGFAEHIDWCDRGYAYIQHLDKVYSEWLCVRQSIKTTTVKPSGSVSLLTGATPGIHYPHAQYYIRRVRFTKNSPMLNKLKSANYPIEQDKYDKNTMVVSFPVEELHYQRGKKDINIWEQLENAAQMQAHWSDNSVSITVEIKEHERNELAQALTRYQSRLKTVSFLPPTHSYEQAPYEEITEEEYRSIASKIKPLNLDDTQHEVTDKFCDSDVCQI